MEDKTTPHLNPEGHQAILKGSDFLAGREAHLQARLNEIEAELVDLGDVPDDVEALEQQVLDSLRTLSELLEPPAPVPAPTSPSEAMPPFLPAMQTRRGRSEAVRRRKFWRVVGIVALLLVAVLSAFSLLWLYGPELVRENGPATPIVQATTSHKPLPPSPTIATPTQPRATETPIPSPTISAPYPEATRSGAPLRHREIIRAELAQILDVSGTLRLELPLSVMTDTVQIVEGMPVLRPVLPANGAGVYRGSAPFGETGNVIIACLAGATPASLWHTRPGDRLVGCNSDGDCHDYQVAAADTWPLDRLHHLLANWPLDGDVLLYAALDESSAWVIQAQPQRQEGTR